MFNGETKKVIAALVTAGIIGAWSFTATRASTEDVKSVKKELRKVEHEAKERDATIAKNVEEISKTIQAEAVAAAAFRAQVRTALKIREAPTR
jgi:hypothetical protein